MLPRTLGANGNSLMPHFNVALYNVASAMSQ